MTLPASGAISLAQIAAEFGLAADTPFPSGFYGKGGAPASGALAFADFYGRAGVVFTPDGGPISESAQGSTSVSLQCNVPALWTYSGGGAGGVVSRQSGTSGTFIQLTVEAFNQLTRDVTWSVTGVAGGVTRSFTVHLVATPNGTGNPEL